MLHFHALDVLPRTNPKESDPVAMSRVHIRLNFEDKTTEFFFARIHRTLPGRSGLRARRIVSKRVEKLDHAKIIDAGTKKNGGLFTPEISLMIKGMAGPLHQLNFKAKFIGLIAENLIEPRIIESFNHFTFDDAITMGGRKQLNCIAIEVIDPLKALPHPNRPGHRSTLDF